MKKIIAGLITSSLVLGGCSQADGENLVKSQPLYERLVALEHEKDWRILLCDVGQHGYLEFPKRPKGHEAPSLARPDSSPKNLKHVKIVERIVRPDAIRTAIYSNVYFYSVNNRQAVPIFGIGKSFDSVGDATFSKDGQRIALWVRTRKDVEAHRSQLVLLDGQGHFQEKLLDALSVGGIAWSSDGVKLAFIGNYRDINDKFIGNTQQHQGEGTLLVFDLAARTQHILIGSGVRSITTYAWSQDDRKIVYEGINDDILIYNFNTRQSRTLIAQGHARGFATWSPSGKWIAYMGADRNYYRIHPDGSGHQLLLENHHPHKGIAILLSILSLFDPSPETDIWGPLIWSPDSRYILYGRTLGRVGVQTMIYALDLQNRQRARLGEFNGRWPLSSWVRTKKENLAY